MSKITARKYLFFALVFVLGLNSLAQGEESFEIEGLVLDKTLTTMGGSFYIQFVRAWQGVTFKNKDALTIVERCTGTTGNVISIKYRGGVIFQKRIEPRRRENQESVTRIAGWVSSRIHALEQNNFPDDLSGNGI